MNLNIKTTNMSMTPAIQDYLEKKLKMLSHLVDFNQNNVHAQVELGKTTQHHRAGDIFKAEINLGIGGRQHYIAAEQEDLYAAIDVMKDDLEQELTRGKEKRKSLFKRGALKIKHMLRFGRQEAVAEDKYDDMA